MECEPAALNASSFADNVSPSTVSFAVNLSPVDFNCEPLK